MQIRLMTDADIARVAALEVCCFSHPWTEAMLSESLHDPLYTFFVAETEAGADDAGKETADHKETAVPVVAGYAGMYSVLDEGNTTNVAVFPEFRGRGIGDLLVEALLRHAKEKELSVILLEVRESNVPAISLYEKHGFTQLGRRRDYYEEPREDARIYGATLC